MLSNYGSSEVFSTYGFVEDYPQYWKYKMNVGSDEEPVWNEVQFCLEKSEEGPLVLRFGSNHDPNSEGEENPTDEELEFLGRHLIRLKGIEDMFKEDTELKASMPQYEWDMAWRYHEALMTSISAALIVDVGPEAVLPEFNREEVVMLAEKVLNDILDEGAETETISDEGSTQQKDNEEDETLTQPGSNLIEWINLNGGYIYPNARIGLDPSGQYLGVFVKPVAEGATAAGIKAGDIVGRIPW